MDTNIKTYSEELMRAYIAYASSFDPIKPPYLHQYIVSKYVEKRQHQRKGRLDEIAHMYITLSTLLGIIRLSKGMTKIYLRDTVKQSDVDEAIKLKDYSIKTLNLYRIAKLLSTTYRVASSGIIPWNAENSKVKKPSQRQDELSKIIGLVRDINSKFEQKDSGHPGLPEGAETRNGLRRRQAKKDPGALLQYERGNKDKIYLV